ALVAGRWRAVHAHGRAAVHDGRATVPGPARVRAGVLGRATARVPSLATLRVRGRAAAGVGGYRAASAPAGAPAARSRQGATGSLGLLWTSPHRRAARRLATGAPAGNPDHDEDERTWRGGHRPTSSSRCGFCDQIIRADAAPPMGDIGLSAR